MATFLTSPIFVEYIFPFLLVFVILFAILEKIKVLGDDNRQINALVALFISLIFLAFQDARYAVVGFMPLFVIAIVFIFIFMFLWGFVGGKVDTGLNKGLKITFGILIAIFVIIGGLFVTGTWDYVYSALFLGESSSYIWTNILVLVLIGGAITVVLVTGKNGGGGSGGKT